MDFIKKALANVKKKLGKEAPGLGFLALHIVKKIQTEMPNASGKEKRDRAISELLEAAKVAGINAGESAVRFLVEGAVSMVKEKVSAAPVAESAAPAEKTVPASGTQKPKSNKK